MWGGGPGGWGGGGRGCRGGCRGGLVLGLGPGLRGLHLLQQGGRPGIAGRGPLLSEFRYGTWSRSFRFPSGIDRENLNAHYQSGLLTVRVPKAQTMTTVSVKVEG